MVCWLHVRRWERIDSMVAVGGHMQILVQGAIEIFNESNGLVLRKEWRTVTDRL